MADTTLHETALEKIQKEWEENNDIHVPQRYKVEAGIRSSQISALVKYLIDIGVINEENV